MKTGNIVIGAVGLAALGGIGYWILKEPRELSNLTITPKTVLLGQAVTMTVKVTNVSDEIRECAVTITTDVESAVHRTMPLNVNESMIISHTWNAENSGKHLVKVTTPSGSSLETYYTVMSVA